MIKLRTPPALRALIRRAACLQGKSRTDFILDASLEKAEEILLDQTAFTVSNPQFKAFNALMDEQLLPKTALQRLLARQVPWEN